MKKEFKSIEEGLRKVPRYSLSPEKNRETLKAFEDALMEEKFYVMSSGGGFFSALTSHIKQMGYAMVALVIVATGAFYFGSNPAYQSHLNNMEGALNELENLALVGIANANIKLDEGSIEFLLQEINKEVQGAIDSAQSIEDSDELESTLKEMEALQAKNILLLNQIGPSIDKDIFDQALTESSAKLERIAEALEQLEKAKSVERAKKSLIQPVKPVSVIRVPAPVADLEGGAAEGANGETILEQEPTFNSFNEPANLNSYPPIPDEIKRFYYDELNGPTNEENIVSVNFDGTSSNDLENDSTVNAVTKENTNSTPTIPDEILLYYQEELDPSISN